MTSTCSSFVRPHPGAAAVRIEPLVCFTVCGGREHEREREKVGGCPPPTSHVTWHKEKKKARGVTRLLKRLGASLLCLFSIFFSCNIFRFSVLQRQP